MVTARAHCGFEVFASDPAVARWAAAARDAALECAADPDLRRANLRHGETWFIGVDVLPNAPDGSIAGVPLDGAWMQHVPKPDAWHRAQLSIIYPDYPKADPDQSEANHRFRVKRFAAHVDGLLQIGPERRRFLREPHGFIVGLPLNDVAASPLMVWPGSHLIMGDAFRACIAQHADPTTVNLTETYHAARAQVFETITPQPVHAAAGQAVLLHRHLLHGVDVWPAGQTAPAEGRMIAYFRPEFSVQSWLSADHPLEEI